MAGDSPAFRQVAPTILQYPFIHPGGESQFEEKKTTQ